jgi:hypothetical protein
MTKSSNGAVCPLHSGLEEKIGAVARDVAEIKSDVKALITRDARERGFRALGRAFAVGLGAAVPLAALIWALWKPNG